MVYFLNQIKETFMGVCQKLRLGCLHVCFARVIDSDLFSQRQQTEVSRRRRARNKIERSRNYYAQTSREIKYEYFMCEAGGRKAQVEMPNLMLYFNKNCWPCQRGATCCPCVLHVRILASSINLRNINNMRGGCNSSSSRAKRERQGEGEG